MQTSHGNQARKADGARRPRLLQSIQPSVPSEHPEELENDDQGERYAKKPEKDAHVNLLLLMAQIYRRPQAATARHLLMFG